MVIDNEFPNRFDPSMLLRSDPPPSQEISSCFWGVNAGGLKLAELARTVGNIDYVSVATAVSRLERRLTRDPKLADMLQRAMMQLQNE